MLECRYHYYVAEVFFIYIIDYEHSAKWRHRLSYIHLIRHWFPPCGATIIFMQRPMCRTYNGHRLAESNIINVSIIAIYLSEIGNLAG